jgi:hypothetical protein
VKAGHNAEPHNHIDVGQFIYHCYGNSFICDLGVGIYDRDYFSSKRYENPICGAEGHNLIFVDGKSEGIGREYEGKIVNYRREEGWEQITIDLSKAYPPEVLSKAIRTLTFFKQNGLLLLDEVTCQQNSLVETRLHFKGSLKQEKQWVDICTERGCIRMLPGDPSIEIAINTHKGLKTHDITATNAPYIRLMKRATEGKVKIKAYIIPYKTTEELDIRFREIKKFL